MGKRFRILSLDGGGIRGIISATWLAELEKKLPHPLHQYFDLIAGTSTGAIIACGVSHGIPASEIAELYENRGREIFPSTASRLWSRLSRVATEGLSAPKYDGKGLKKVLKDAFKSHTFGTLKQKTLVTSYDVTSRKAVIFKSNKAKHKMIPIWKVCKASSSAPTYFPATTIELNGLDSPLIDGGVVANNPTACAIAEAVKLQATLDSLEVFSLGTGKTNRPISAEEANDWGASQWVIPMIDVLFDGSADSVDYIASQIVPASNYFRFQPKLDKAYDDMDNADRSNLEALRRCAIDYMENEQTRFDALIGRLKS